MPSEQWTIANEFLENETHRLDAQLLKEMKKMLIASQSLFVFLNFLKSLQQVKGYASQIYKRCPNSDTINPNRYDRYNCICLLYTSDAADE